MNIGQEFCQYNNWRHCQAKRRVDIEIIQMSQVLDSQFCLEFEEWEGLALNLFALRLIEISLRTGLF